MFLLKLLNEKVLGSETLSWYKEKCDRTHTTCYTRKVLFPVLGPKQDVPDNPPSPWQSHLTLLSPEIAEADDIFHLVGELKLGASRLLKVVIASM